MSKTTQDALYLCPYGNSGRQTVKRLKVNCLILSVQTMTNGSTKIRAN